MPGVAVFMGLVSVGCANTVQFATGPQKIGSLAENATATFVIDNTSATHSITVTLLNLVANPTNSNEPIRSLRFTIGNAGTPTPTMGTVVDTKLDISSNGSPTNVSQVGTSPWGISTLSQGVNWEQLALCTVCTHPNGRANGLVIGGPNGTGSRAKYSSSASPSLRDNVNAGRWLIGSGSSLAYISGSPFYGKNVLPSWTINVGTTDLSSLKITNVIFGFGESSTTDYGWGTITVPQETPEPDSVILFGTGIALVAIAAGVRRWRRR